MYIITVRYIMDCNYKFIINISIAFIKCSLFMKISIILFELHLLPFHIELQIILFDNKPKSIQFNIFHSIRHKNIRLLRI